MVVNLGTNCLPVGADATGMFPKYITIVRGQLLCWLLCPLLFPWKIVSSGSAFLAFLGSYSVMLCPIAATMIYDYFFIRKGNLHIPSLYNPDKSSMFWYGNKYGLNWRAFAAWAVGLGLTISGVSDSIRPGSVAIGAVRIYKLGFLLSFISAFLAYGVICYFFPVPQPLPNDMDLKDVTFEQFAETDGFLENESLDDITGGDSSILVIDGQSNDSATSVLEKGEGQKFSTKEI